MPSVISGFLSKRGAGRANVRQDISNYKGMIMPVTKCEPETTRKASRKSVKTQETALSALLAQTEEVSVPLDSLIKSPLNVRTVPYSAESVSELADSIKGVGLLQNLVVHALPGDRYGVAAGGRRLAALNMLAERDIIPADWPVRVKIIPQELATAASMTENGHRRDMHPAEQIAGFRAMAQEGKTPAHIGDLLGYSPRHVQRMLKLADLAPVILDALAEDRITTEHCQALALENDTARQVQVFEAACQSGWGGKPEVQTIRRLVTESEVAVAGNSKFRFVGADAFSPDELRTDLCRCFAFLRHCAESGNLFGRVHIPTLTVLGHRCSRRQLLRNDLHAYRPVSRKDVAICQHVECCQSATACGDTVTVTWQGMNNQIL